MEDQWKKLILLDEGDGDDDENKEGENPPP